VTLCYLSFKNKKTNKHFATFDFFAKMKLVSTVWVSTSQSKSDYLQVAGTIAREVSLLLRHMPHECEDSGVQI
jgi:hypothetical protein